VNQRPKSVVRETARYVLWESEAGDRLRRPGGTENGARRHRARPRLYKSRAASGTSSSTRSASLNVVIHAADIQDRDGAVLVLDARTRRLFPFIQRIFADGGYQGPHLAQRVVKTGTWLIEIV
jgi:hypothetical protein